MIKQTYSFCTLLRKQDTRKKIKCKNVNTNKQDWLMVKDIAFVITCYLVLLQSTASFEHSCSHFQFCSQILLLFFYYCSYCAAATIILIFPLSHRDQTKSAPSLVLKPLGEFQGHHVSFMFAHTRFDERDNLLRNKENHSLPSQLQQQVSGYKRIVSLSERNVFAAKSTIFEAKWLHFKLENIQKSFHIHLHL